MSGAWRVVLLLWGCVCLRLAVPAHGALVISRDGGALTQENNGAIRSLKRRSISNFPVEVQSVTIDCKVKSRFAHTVMTSTASNIANISLEVFFEVELPKTAFITNFSMEIEGQIYTGEVKEKEKAKIQYQKAVSSGQTAGLVKASGRKMEKFSVSVNIKGRSNVTFTLTYEELLQRKLGRYEILTRVKPKQLVQNFKIVVDIYEPQGIDFVEAHGTFMSNELLPLVKKTVTDKKAHISFSPTLDQQKFCPDCNGTLIDGDFIIKYDVNRAQNLGDIQIANGYFVHFFAPPDLPRVPKNVVFVIDRSGSMSGRKIQQTREALLAILGELHRDDYFALIIFDHEVVKWKDSVIQATENNIAEAMTFVNEIRDSGTTDINKALLTAVDMLAKDTQNLKLPERSLSMIILLTDGMPISGETHLPKIQENVRGAIDGNMSLFSLGFGDDVQFSFLEVLAQQNRGLARKIFEGSDATLQLQGFYEEVSSPVLSKVDLRYPDNAVDFLTTNHFGQLFNGSEIVVAGRVNDLEMDNFLVEVFAQGSEEDFQVQGQASAQEWDVIYPEEQYIFGDFTERMWAYLTIQQLLEKRASGDTEERANATAKALEMSLQYGFVTPLTSMVVTKPENKDGDADMLIADKLTEDQRQRAGSHGGYQFPSMAQQARYHYTSSPTQYVDGDPHFMIELPDREDALCFNIDDSPGTILNLVRDPLSGLVVNGQVIGDKKVIPGEKVHTYFGRFGVQHQTLGVRLEVTTQFISVFEDGKLVKLSWADTASLKGTNMDIHVTKERNLTVSLKDSVRFVILLHKVWEKHPYHKDYLGFYTLDSHLLSSSVHGLLGQFYHGVEFEVGDLRPGEVPEKPDATLMVKGYTLRVTRGWQRDFRGDMEKGEDVPCWFVHSNGAGLVDGTLSDYVVNGLFQTV